MTSGKRHRPLSGWRTMAQLEKKGPQRETAGQDSNPPDAPPLDLDGAELGPQPNGDFRIIVTIPEGYVEGVRQWAESDGLSMEEWLDHRLSDYLETWSSPARGR